MGPGAAEVTAGPRAEEVAAGPRVAEVTAGFRAVGVAAWPVLRGEIGTADPAFAVPNPFANSIRTADSRFPYGE